MSRLCSMIIRCRSVEPDRHPAESRKIGCASHSRACGDTRASASSRRDSISLDASTDRFTRFRAHAGPKIAWRNVLKGLSNGLSNHFADRCTAVLSRTPFALSVESDGFEGFSGESVRCFIKVTYHNTNDRERRYVSKRKPERIRSCCSPPWRRLA